MFQPVQSKKIHQQVFEQIQSLVVEGQLKPGDRLPSERDLVELLHVSRNSIREALRALEVLGIIECRHGGGNEIKCDISSGILEPLSLVFRLHGGTFSDILEMRRVLESEAAALAAERITPERAEELSRVIETFHLAADDAESIKQDKAFHLKIAESSGNVLFLTFLTAVSSLLERSILFDIQCYILYTLFIKKRVLINSTKLEGRTLSPLDARIIRTRPTTRSGSRDSSAEYWMSGHQRLLTTCA